MRLNLPSARPDSVRLEDYELQKVAEDPFRIEREPDLRKEQEEYFRRIRQEWMDPGSSE